ncbi:amidophosphoribosyltransferase [Candidatus Woesearchaeota archaeon]|nr:amidophosphoribosyltransferase [Candidatus Woesearchaeota archaeon]
MAEVHDECGIAGVWLREGNAAPQLYKMLLHLQNRGQLSAGLTTYSSKRGSLLRTYKNLGTVNEVFRTRNERTGELFSRLSGEAGIGHVRYSTFGKASRCYAHPFERKHGRKDRWFSFCFNGNIANYPELKRQLLSSDEYHLMYDSDTEIIMHYLARALDSASGKPNLREVFAGLAGAFDGAYSLAYLDAEGRLAAVRDPCGIRPLCYAVEPDRILFASESVALANLGCGEIRSLGPGEMLLAEGGAARVERFSLPIRKAHCMFEYVYFANVASTIEGRAVYQARVNLGKEMAKEETLAVNAEEYVAVSVPDSSKPFGEGYAFALGLPHREGLVRNRFIGRTFIEESERADKVKNKFSMVREVIEGKKVILLDDSIVRGTTSRQLISYLRQGGAREVHLRVSCPPIVSPCFYGVDMSTFSELVASRFAAPGKEMDSEATAHLASELGADSLIYQKLEKLPAAIGLPAEELCMGCLTGQYPTPAGQRLCASARGITRAYEVRG